MLAHVQRFDYFSQGLTTLDNPDDSSRIDLQIELCEHYNSNWHRSRTKLEQAGRQPRVEDKAACPKEIDELLTTSGLPHAADGTTSGILLAKKVILLVRWPRFAGARLTLNPAATSLPAISCSL